MLAGCPFSSFSVRIVSVCIVSPSFFFIGPDFVSFATAVLVYLSVFCSSADLSDWSSIEI